MFHGMPIFYACDRCTACCRWPGQVRITSEEIARLAAFVGHSEFEFIQNYTRLSTDRQGLVLKDKASGECIFLEGNDCVVNAVKPQQCRDFPNLWNFPGFQEVCRAREILMEDEAYAEAIERATGRKPPNSARCSE
jgi:Fe-S-cluster containining protein